MLVVYIVLLHYSFALSEATQTFSCTKTHLSDPNPSYFLSSLASLTRTEKEAQPSKVSSSSSRAWREAETQVSASPREGLWGDPRSAPWCQPEPCMSQPECMGQGRKKCRPETWETGRSTEGGMVWGTREAVNTAVRDLS